jgi:hypothetical protein
VPVTSGVILRTDREVTRPTSFWAMIGVPSAITIAVGATLSEPSSWMIGASFWGVIGERFGSSPEPVESSSSGLGVASSDFLPPQEASAPSKATDIAKRRIMDLALSRPTTPYRQASFHLRSGAPARTCRGQAMTEAPGRPPPGSAPPRASAPAMLYRVT